MPFFLLWHSLIQRSRLLRVSFRVGSQHRVICQRYAYTFKASFDKDLSETHRSTALQETSTWLRNILSEKNMDNVSFEIQEVDELSVDNKTGKFRLILSPN